METPRGSQMPLPSCPAKAFFPPQPAIPHGKTGGGQWDQGLASLGASPAKRVCSAPGCCYAFHMVSNPSSWGEELLHSHDLALPACSRAKKLIFKSKELLFKGAIGIPVQTSL